MDIRLAIACVIVLMNVVGFILMGIDKSRARRGAWRVSERALFTVAILTGSLGVLAGMYTFRHKTKHASFVIGIPLILVVEVALAIWLTVR